MKPAEYREMSEEQLDLTLKDTVKHLFHLRFQSATERLETPSEISKAKRDVARIMTIQRERRRKGGKKTQPPSQEEERICGATQRPAPPPTPRRDTPGTIMNTPPGATP